MTHLIDKSAVVAEIMSRIDSIEVSQKAGLIKKRDAETKIILFKSILSLIDTFEVREVQEEPASKDKFTFTSLPRLLDRIKPTDRVKWYSSRLADALEEEGYITDAKIVRESINLMNGEKVPMATMDEEPVSKGLEEASEEFCKSTLVGSPYVKKSAFKAGANWQKQQMMAKAIDGTARPDDNEIWCNLASFNLKDGDKVKVIVIKEE